MAPRKPQSLDKVLQEMYRCWFPSTKSQELCRVCETNASPNATGWGHIRYWRHSHLRDVVFKTVKWISCDIQMNCISSFENLHGVHAFMRDFSVDIFARNDWPLCYLTLCHNKGIGASNLKWTCFSTDDMYLNKKRKLYNCLLWCSNVAWFSEISVTFLLSILLYWSCHAYNHRPVQSTPFTILVLHTTG